MKHERLSSAKYIAGIAARAGQEAVRRLLSPPVKPSPEEILTADYELERHRLQAEHEQRLAEFSPEQIVKNFFYAPYVATRTRLVQQVREETAIDVATSAEHASYISLIAASKASYELCSATGNNLLLDLFQTPALAASSKL